MARCLRPPRGHRCPKIKCPRLGLNRRGSLGRRQCLLKQPSNLVIARRARNDLMPFQNAPRVSVHYKDWMIAGIQQNRIGGLWPYAIQREQFIAELGRWPREHSRQRPTITLVQKADKRLQVLRFLSEVTGRTNQSLKLRLRRVPDSSDGQPPRFPKVAERLLNVRPGSVLR